MDLSLSGLSDSYVRINPLAEGNTVVTVTASDGSSTATQTIAVTVLSQNSAPLAVGTIPAQTLTAAGTPYQVDVAANFNAPNIYILTYTVSSDDTNVATATVLGSVVTITPHNAGSATITVTASDGSLTATQTIVVTVEKMGDTDVCDRTPKVRNAIVAAVNGVSDCGDVTTTNLAAIRSLDVSHRGVTSIKSGDFDRLSDLQMLHLNDNQLSSLDPDIFDGLNNLQHLNLHWNRLSSLDPAYLQRA